MPIEPSSEGADSPEDWQSQPVEPVPREAPPTVFEPSAEPAEAPAAWTHSQKNRSPEEVGRRRVLRRQLLWALVVFLVLTVVMTECDFGLSFAQQGLLGLALIGTILGILGVLVARLMRKDWIALRGSVLLVSALAAARSTTHMIRDHYQHVSKEAAGRIVLAVEQYHAKNGEYPETLSELVPRFLPSIERAQVSWFREHSFYYGRDEDGTSYGLGFDVHGDYSHSYSSKRQYWRMHD